MRYKDYMAVFSKKRAQTLAPHRQIGHAIDLEPDFNISFGQIYNYSEVEFKTFKA